MGRAVVQMDLLRSSYDCSDDRSEVKKVFEDVDDDFEGFQKSTKTRKFEKASVQ